jgi:hypothetical protein
MRKCPKCQLTYGDDASRICRACGAILDEVATEPAMLDAWLSEPAEAPQAVAARDDRFDETVLPVDLADAAATLPKPTTEPWVCTQCGERVPANFDFCWNCEAAAEPLPAEDTDIAPTETPSVAPPIVPKILAKSVTRLPRPRCSKCQATQMMAGVTVLDRGQGSPGNLNVVVYGDPDALLFKNTLYGELVADICGACGHVELRVLNPGELYQRTRRSSP